MTPGALQHHFASKVALLGELVGYIRAKTMSEMFAEGVPSTRSIRRRHELLLDRMWRIYRGPLFTTLIELAIGARTEPELLRHIAGSHDEMGRLNAMAAPILFPEHAERPELVPLIVSGQSTMRGLALMGLAGEADPDPLWPATRAHIMAMNAQVLGDPKLSP